MHEHDLDLIAALADGSLRDETEARALVESCPECRAEYQGQVAVLYLLTSTPGAEMTELEKAALHRDVWTELRDAPSRAASTPWWQRWSYVAAGLFVTVGLVGVLSSQIQLGGGEAGDTVADSASALDADPARDEEVPFRSEESATEGGAESAATTTAAAEGTLPLPFEALADEARAKRETADQSFGTMSGRDEVESCLDRAGLSEHIVVDEIELDQRYLLLMPEDPQADPTVTFIAVDGCEIVFVDG